MAACAVGQAPDQPDGGTTSTGTGGTGGGGPDLPCGVDCTKFETAPCSQAVCNTGQYDGPLNTCIVVPAPDGTQCDDGQFCTTGDSCSNGKCVGGDQNTCGLPLSPCVAVICYEDMKSCQSTPVNDGAACTPTDLCQDNGVCSIGDCIGQPKDCTFSPLNECNKVACNPATGKCEGTPDPDKDDSPCLLTGDVCSVEKTCKSGQCGGGVPKDCSALDVGCQVGVCNASTGICDSTPAPLGTACSDGIPECHVGACDSKGGCSPQTAPDGVACNDHDSCTKGDTCSSGVCSGNSVSGCSLYLYEGFEVCNDGWTFGGDWECGKPVPPSPVAPHTGNNVIATQLDGLYHVNQSFTTAVATSPTIDLTTATAPQLSFWAWDQTEGQTFDGWNLKISVDGGAFTEVTTVTPAYPLTILTQPAWGGDHSAEGWKNYLANLSAYAGHSVKLQFSFRSDGATVFTGVYIDDVVVSEPLELPLFISTPSLPDVFAGEVYSQPLVRTGGDSNAVWSINGGGTNTGWLNIDTTTGALTGTPSQSDVGPVSVTVHVEEPSLPSNFAEKTYTFHVKPDLYFTNFEGTCPDGWTLAGDWQCGVPTPLTPPAAPPPSAFSGNQCIATQIAANYHDNETYAGCTATSPVIDLTGVTNPKLTFRMWVDTEGATYDGFNLQVSNDGGMNYTIVNSVMPAYNLSNVGGKPAWGAHQSALGWQLVTADLSAFTNQTIIMRFAFRSDSSGNFAGIYIDDILVD